MAAYPPDRGARPSGVVLTREDAWQDLAVAPLLSVWRNFFLGAEPTRGAWPLRRLDVELDAVSQRFATEHGLNRTDVRALVAVMDAARHGQALTAGGLGAAVDLRSASVTALVDRLERVGHVRRVRDDDEAVPRHRRHRVRPPAQRCRCFRMSSSTTRSILPSVRTRTS